MSNCEWWLASVAPEIPKITLKSFFTKPLVVELNFIFVGLVDGNLALPQNSEKMEYNFCLLKK